MAFIVGSRRRRPQVTDSARNRRPQGARQSDESARFGRNGNGRPSRGSSAPTCPSPAAAIAPSGRPTPSPSRPSSSLRRTTIAGTASPLTDAHAEAFRSALGQTGIVGSRGAHLVPDQPGQPGRRALAEDRSPRWSTRWSGAGSWESPTWCCIPGAHMGEGEEAGVARVARGLDEVCRRTAGCGVVIDLETTAGQGTCLGHRFEHLGAHPRPREPAGAAGCLRRHLPYFRRGLSLGHPGGVR